MLHESCDVVDDAGGWTCRTCRAHWRTAVAPSACAEDWPPIGRWRIGFIAAVAISVFAVGMAVAAVVVVVRDGLAPAAAPIVVEETSR